VRGSQAAVTVSGMILFLLGSDSAHRVHLHLVSSGSEHVPWSTGKFFESRPREEFVLHANALQLGTGALRIATVSFVSAYSDDVDAHLLAPLHAVGSAATADDELRLVLHATDNNGRLSLSMASSAVKDGETLAVDDPARVKLLVDTYMMGRAEYEVNTLRCVGPSGPLDPDSARLLAM
jgi:hypothetical protein